MALHDSSDAADSDGKRRTEVLETAASLIASSGLRTSLQEIADAAGILPGSLYHHFESKEAILVELIRRYHDDLDRIGKAALDKLDEPDSRPAAESIIELGSAIARCAAKHGAALQMSFYEAPSSNRELIKLLQERPTGVQQAMLQTLRAGRWSGYIRSDIDLPTLADRIVQSTLHAGLDVIRNNSFARTGGVSAVPNHVGGSRNPAPKRCRVGSLQCICCSRRRYQHMERRERFCGPRQGCSCSRCGSS